MDAEGRTLHGPALRDAESLLRRLVGIRSVSIRLREDGALGEVLIVPSNGTGEKRIARNVVSALKARFGIDLDPSAIRIAGPAADNGKGGGGHGGESAPSMDHAAPARATHDAHAHTNGNGHGPVVRETPAPHNPNTSGHATRAAGSEAPSVSAAGASAPVVFLGPARVRLEHAEIRRSADNVRCRVIVVTGSERFIGVADAFESDATDVELAARVTVDALRAARAPREPVQLEGAEIIDVAGKAHVIVSLAVWNGSDFDAIAGAEPVHGSAIDAAALAVIGAINGRMLN